jgi:hypothetical protein
MWIAGEEQGYDRICRSGGIGPEFLFTGKYQFKNDDQNKRYDSGKKSL